MNIIILGDKYIKGMKSKGCVGLLKYNNKHIIDNQYNILKKQFPTSKIIYVYGFDSKKLLAHIYKKSYKDIQLLNNEEYDCKNTAYSLSLAKDFLEEETLIVSGSCNLQHILFKKFNPIKSQIFVYANTQDKYNNIGCIINKNMICNISPELGNCLYDIYYFGKKESELLKKMVSQNKYHNYFLFELINKIIDAGYILHPYILNTSKQNKMDAIKK
jgi:CTP:phosphocholine cytidylyltransferase-like protein